MSHYHLVESKMLAIFEFLNQATRVRVGFPQDFVHPPPTEDRMEVLGVQSCAPEFEEGGNVH